jgi:hypothetical protein
MQCGLHHRITANGHGRMCSGSPITILFLTCEPVPPVQRRYGIPLMLIRITGVKCRTAIVVAPILAGIAHSARQFGRSTYGPDD